jgi:hypothetical protein
MSLAAMIFRKCLVRNLAILFFSIPHLISEQKVTCDQLFWLTGKLRHEEGFF